MNCIDVHRKLITEPSHPSEDILAHLTECSACANFSESIKEFDQSLINAANINVPDGLVERILLKQNFKQQHQQRTMRVRLIVLAASLVIVFGIIFNMASLHNMLGDSLTLEEVALNHVIDEYQHLSDKKDIKLAALNNVLQPFNIKLKSTIGQINYADTCPIRNSRGVHIVLRNNNNIATVLVMPGEYISAPKHLTKGNLSTTIVPIQNGSIAIITNKDSGSDFSADLEQTLRRSMSYI